MPEMLTAVAILFVIAGPFLLFANQYNLPAAPLLIIAGILGGLFIDEEIALELAQFGIALLVFSFGVGIQLANLQAILADSEFAAIGQIIIVGALGTGFGVLIGIPLDEAIYLGVAAALSSTIVGTALLQLEIQRDLVQGRLADSIQFVQDLFAIGFLLIVGAGALAPDPIATQVGYGVFFLVAAYFVNRFLFNPFGRLAGRSDELMIIAVFSLLAVFIGAAAVVEVSIVVGAFAAGLAVRHDPGEYLGLFNGIESIKDFFVAIFFAIVGALVTLPFVGDIGIVESVEKLILAAGLVVLAIIVKPAVTTAILSYRGYEARTATLTGLSTNQVSEFSLIIAIQALLVGFLTESVFDAIILAAAVTMIISPLLHPYDERIYRSLADMGIVSGKHDKIDRMSHVPSDITNHAIIVGFGHKGRRLVEAVEALEHPYVVIENDPALRAAVRIECEAYVFGDAMEAYTWEKANVEAATAIVSVTSSRPVSERLLAFDFDVPLILRATNEREAIELLNSGAKYVSVPDLLASEELNQYLRALLEGDISVGELREEGMSRLKQIPQSHRDRW